MRIAVLASHHGSTLQAVVEACATGLLDAHLVLVVSNNSSAGALTRAREADIPTAHISTKTSGSDTATDLAILAAMQDAEVDLILLLGYMKKLGPRTLSAYRGRILNTHPSLLPKYGGQGFFGRKVHEAVIAAGDPVSGATIHRVEADYDTGDMLAQCEVPVLPGDTPASLEQRVKSAEQQLLIDTLRNITLPTPGAPEHDRLATLSRD